MDRHWFVEHASVTSAYEFQRSCVTYMSIAYKRRFESDWQELTLEMQTRLDMVLCGVWHVKIETMFISIWYNDEYRKFLLGVYRRSRPIQLARQRFSLYFSAYTTNVHPPAL
jgi:hypothetical protein